MINLQTLFLSKNMITELICRRQINTLKTENNNFSVFTEIKNIDNLSNLQELYLYNNRITEITNIDNLVNLQILYLSNNMIT